MGEKELTRKILISLGKNSIWLTSSFQVNNGDTSHLRQQKREEGMSYRSSPQTPSYIALLIQNM